MKKTSKIYVSGHRGLVGSAIVRLLKEKGFVNMITRTRNELDLTKQKDVLDFFIKEKPEFVFLSAAKVGGIMANKTYPADFIRDNLSIELNVIESARLSKAKKLLFLGSSCIYPRLAPQPMKEEYFLDGKLEETNKAYSVAKIAGIEMCQAYNKQYGTNFISVMPTNIYGLGDNFNPESSHVIPALIRKFYEAKISSNPSVVLWGSGKAYREFLYVDDLADACMFLMDAYNYPEIINVGTGEDITIRELAMLIQQIVGYNGEIIWDTEKPDGAPRKLLDVSKLNKLGWKYTTALKDGIEATYEWYKKNY
ncbi:MAG: GDP-L-fucose synthase [Patescibacteria group bacterium]